MLSWRRYIWWQAKYNVQRVPPSICQWVRERVAVVVRFPNREFRRLRLQCPRVTDRCLSLDGAPFEFLIRHNARRQISDVEWCPLLPLFIQIPENLEIYFNHKIREGSVNAHFWNSVKGTWRKIPRRKCSQSSEPCQKLHTRKHVTPSFLLPLLSIRPSNNRIWFYEFRRGAKLCGLFLRLIVGSPPFLLRIPSLSHSPHSSFKGCTRAFATLSVRLVQLYIVEL